MIIRRYRLPLRLGQLPQHSELAWVQAQSAARDHAVAQQQMKIEHAVLMMATLHGNEHLREPLSAVRQLYQHGPAGQDLAKAQRQPVRPVLAAFHADQYGCRARGRFTHSRRKQGPAAQAQVVRRRNLAICPLQTVPRPVWPKARLTTRP